MLYKNEIRRGIPDRSRVVKLVRLGSREEGDGLGFGLISEVLAIGKSSC